MPKKVTVASAIALVLLIILIVILANAVPKNTESTALPETVTVYVKERNEIIKLDYDEFLEGCLCGFIPYNGVLYEPATLEALCVVINTNALYRLQNRGKFDNFGADISTGELFPYVDYSEKAINHADRKIIKDAVKNAGKKYLTFNGKPFLAEFCHISSGKTLDRSPIMPSVKLPSDVLCKGYQSENAYTVNEVRALSEIKNLREPPEKWFSEPVYDDCGTLISIMLCNQKITGETIKNTLGLRSSAISIKFEDDCFVMVCKGWGNNIGMSLSAADAFSREGKTAEEILKIFYNADN